MLTMTEELAESNAAANVAEWAISDSNATRKKAVCKSCWAEKLNGCEH